MTDTDTYRCADCEATFEDEQRYREHRRLRHGDAVDGGRSWRLVAVVAVVAVLLGVGALATVVPPGSLLGGDATDAGTPTPHDLGTRHYHGTIVVVVDGHRVDFSQGKYQLQDKYFHMEGGGARRWHVHGEGVTLKYAIDTFYRMNLTADSFTYEGRTYDADDPGTTVTVTVNGQPVTPSSYVLRKGDAVRIVVETDDAGTG